MTAIIIVVVMGFHKREAMRTIQAGDDRRQLPEIQIETPDETRRGA
jgi:hypothetical protein